MKMRNWPWGQKQEKLIAQWEDLLFDVKASILEPNSDPLPIKRLAERLAKIEAWIAER